MSVRLSVSHKNPSASQNHAYQPNLPISHNATMPPLSASQNHNYWPSCLSAIMPSCLSAIMPVRPSDLCPAFATFKPFRLVLLNETFPKPSNSMYLDIRKMIFETPVILHYIRSENQRWELQVPDVKLKGSL